jgi:hypothetical protein
LDYNDKNEASKGWEKLLERWGTTLPNRKEAIAWQGGGMTGG